MNLPRNLKETRENRAVALSVTGTLILFCVDEFVSLMIEQSIKGLFDATAY